MLNPDVYQMKDGNTMTSHPDTKRYLTRDIFTYISYTLNPEKNQDTAHFNIHSIPVGDTIFYSKGYIRLNKIIKNPVENKFNLPVPANGALLAADITITDKDSMHYTASPMISIDNFDSTDNSGINSIDDTVYAQNLFLKFDRHYQR